MRSVTRFIADFYCAHWTQYLDSKGQSGFVRPSAPDRESALTGARVRRVIESAGFCELPDEWLIEELSGVTLELAGAEAVTIGKCLFDDYEG